MTDRELLELAAKAAGYDKPGQWDDKWNCLFDHEGWTFGPLTDDGDALRLAVKLKINVEWESAEVVWADNNGEAVESDPYAATRRAIVRAAAEIGKAMT